MSLWKHVSRKQVENFPWKDQMKKKNVLEYIQMLFSSPGLEISHDMMYGSHSVLSDSLESHGL